MFERIGSMLNDSGPRVYWVKKDGEWRSEGKDLAALGGEDPSLYQGRRYIASLLNSGLVSPLEARAAARAWRTGKISPSRPMVTLEAARLSRETRGLKRMRWVEQNETRRAVSFGQNEGVARALAGRGWIEGALWLGRRGMDWEKDGEDALLGFFENNDLWYLNWEKAHLELRRWTLELPPGKARAVIAALGGPTGDKTSAEAVWSLAGAVASSRDAAAAAAWTGEAAERGWWEGLMWMARNILPGGHARPLRLLDWRAAFPERSFLASAGPLFAAWAAAKSEARPSRLAAYAATFGSLQARAVVIPDTARAVADKCRCIQYGGEGWVGEDGHRGDPKRGGEWLEFWRRWAAACEVDFAGEVL